MRMEQPEMPWDILTVCNLRMLNAHQPTDPSIIIPSLLNISTQMVATPSAFHQLKVFKLEFVNQRIRLAY